MSSRKITRAKNTVTESLVAPSGAVQVPSVALETIAIKGGTTGATAGSIAASVPVTVDGTTYYIQLYDAPVA